MKTQLHDAVDAFSASAAIRLRYQFLAAKHGGTASIAAILPPPVGIPRQGRTNPTSRARRDRHELAHLMKLRDQAAAEIERLLTFLDETDGIEDLEPSSGMSLAPGEVEEAEGGPYCPDREGDELNHGGDEHDGAEPDVDLESSLGWTEGWSLGTAGSGGCADGEAGSHQTTDAARDRYSPMDRWQTNRDGKHIDAERGYSRGSRRLRNLTDQQKASVKPRIDRKSGVSVMA